MGESWPSRGDESGHGSKTVSRAGVQQRSREQSKWVPDQLAPNRESKQRGGGHSLRCRRPPLRAGGATLSLQQLVWVAAGRLPQGSHASSPRLLPTWRCSRPGCRPALGALRSQQPAAALARRSAGGRRWPCCSKGGGREGQVVRRVERGKRRASWRHLQCGTGRGSSPRRCSAAQMQQQRASSNSNQCVQSHSPKAQGQQQGQGSQEGTMITAADV